MNPKKRAPLALVWLAAGSLAMAAAHAARPLQTDDAGALARGDCEIEVSAQRVRDAGTNAHEVGMALGCGVGAQTQLGLGVAWARAAGEREQGLSIAGKTTLRQADAGPALAVSWELVAAHLPADAWRYVGSGVTLLATQALDDATTLHVNLGHGHDSLAHQGSTGWGVGLERAGLAVMPALAPMAEIFGDDREAPWWNLGLRWTAVPDKLFFDLSFGRQMRGGQPSLLSAGLKLAF